MVINALISILACWQMASAGTPAGPTVVQVAGQPVTATWPDGGQVTLMLNRNKPIILPVPFTLSENQCAATPIGQTFTVGFAIRQDVLAWVWTGNSDRSKIGQIFSESEGGSSSMPLTASVIVFNSQKYSSPDLILDLPPDSLNFTDVSWIPGMSANGLKPFTIANWTVESMTMNTETGITQNEVVSSLANVQIQPSNASNAVIAGFDSITTLEEGSEYPMAGDLVNWIFHGQSQDCSISFKPDITAANKALGTYVSSPSNVFTQYLWQQDSLSTTNSYIVDEIQYATE
jgi:hypothetical protein